MITVPPEEGQAYEKGDGNDLSAFERFPTLPRTVDLLDRLGTRLYEDALIPVALAHHWAAYPLASADRVLRVLTERTLQRDEEGG